MTTYRVQHNKENPYAKLDKRFLRSPNLSAKAKGILAYLLSLPSDWRVCLNHLITVFADGEVSIRSGISELKKAGYLSKAAIRDSTGQIVNWVTDVYETPHQFDRATDKNGNFIVKVGDGKIHTDVSTERTSHGGELGSPLVSSQVQILSQLEDYPDVGNPHLGNLDVDNRGQLINKDPLRNKFTNPPLPSQAGGRERENFELCEGERNYRRQKDNNQQQEINACQNLEQEQEIETSQDRHQQQQINAHQDLYLEPIASNFPVAKESTLLSDNFSAANFTKLNEITECSTVNLVENELDATKKETRSQSKQKSTTKHLDGVLATQPYQEEKNDQQRHLSWIAEGPWLVEGKLDPGFVNWLAQSWQLRYGGTFHQKRSDVLRHFKKDPVNLAIAWEQYRVEQVQRYENAAVRMGNGLEIQPTEQEQLLQNVRAVTHPLPQELNPVAAAVDLPVLVGKIKAEITETAMPPSEQAIPVNTLGECLLEDKKNQQPPSHSFPLCPRAGGLRIGDKASSATIPTLGDGCAENPSSYQQWQPQTELDEPIVASLFKEKLATFNSLLLMSSTKSTLHRPSSNSVLEELNTWLKDPILKDEAMARVMRSERYTVEFDDGGEPLRIVEIEIHGTIS